MKSQTDLMQCFWSTGSFARHHVCVAGSKPTMGRHQSRSSLPKADMPQSKEGKGVALLSPVDVCAESRGSNQSLERTPVEQGCFASPVVCGRRSAHR